MAVFVGSSSGCGLCYKQRNMNEFFPDEVLAPFIDANGVLRVDDGVQKSLGRVSDPDLRRLVHQKGTLRSYLIHILK